MNNSLRERILKNTTLTTTDVLADSTIFNEKEIIPTDIPGINIALSGTPFGGLMAGVTMIAGESKHFKTGFCLLLAQAFLKKHPAGIILFYDSEFGTPQHYFDNFGIPKEQVVHSPITNIEELKHDITVQLKGINRGDEVLIIIDSIGNVASIKEVTDAEEGKSTADMTRAKQLKSLFRIITPHLTLKNIPLICVNHTYKEIGLYPKDIVSGGTGSYYNSNDIWIVGRQQDKDESGLHGYNFVINIEKSRAVKEKSKIAINVTFEDGIFKWSGLFDNALESGMITSGKKGFYQIRGDEKNYRRGDLEGNDAFWEEMVKNEEFISFIEKKYRLAKT